MQNPVPLSNQSLFLSSYTFTLFLSFGGGATCAIARAHPLLALQTGQISPLESPSYQQYANLGCALKEYRVSIYFNLRGTRLVGVAQRYDSSDCRYGTALCDLRRSISSRRRMGQGLLFWQIRVYRAMRSAPVREEVPGQLRCSRAQCEGLSANLLLIVQRLHLQKSFRKRAMIRRWIVDDTQVIP